jgi:hypothetical protein
MTEEELAAAGITPEEYQRFAEADRRAWSKDRESEAEHRALLADYHLRMHVQMHARGALSQAQLIASIRSARAQLPQQTVDRSRATDMTDACPMATAELEDFDLTREQCEAMADSQFRSDVSRQRWGGLSRAQFVASIDAARGRARARAVAPYAKVCGLFAPVPSMHGPAATQLAGAFFDAGMTLRETGEHLRAVVGSKSLTAQQIATIKDNLRAHAAARNYWENR